MSYMNLTEACGTQVWATALCCFYLQVKVFAESRPVRSRPGVTRWVVVILAWRTTKRWTGVPTSTTATMVPARMELM